MGLRERKKAATRQALHEAALRLAVEHGPDKVTVEAIADAAMVSRRTFSNYFAGKEDALLHGDQVRLRRLVDLVSAQPTGEPVLTSLRRAADQLSSERIDPLWVQQRRLVRRHPSLAARQIANYGAAERDLAAEIARRLPAEPGSELRSRVLAAVFLSALRAATQHWVDHSDEPLSGFVREALTVLR